MSLKYEPASEPLRVGDEVGGEDGRQGVEREFFSDNLLVRIHYIIVMIRWTGLAPWELCVEDEMGGEDGRKGVDRRRPPADLLPCNRTETGVLLSDN